ncbi:YceI family protein [Streptomyces sp. NPDC005122]
MFRPEEATVSRPALHEELTGVHIIDPARSAIGFSARRAMTADVLGNFTVFEGLLKLDGACPTGSEAYLSVQTGSADTGCRERDAHLTGPEFLDSATFPLMCLRSTKVLEAGSAWRGASGSRTSSSLSTSTSISSCVRRAGKPTDATASASRVRSPCGAPPLTPAGTRLGGQVLS